MKSILAKFDVRMLAQFTKSMQVGDEQGVCGGSGSPMAGALGRPPVPSGLGGSFRLGNGKVVLLSDFATLAMHERHAVARRPVTGSCFQCGSRLVDLFDCERCIVAEAAFASVSGSGAPDPQDPHDDDRPSAARLERQYEAWDRLPALRSSDAPDSSVWSSYGSVVVALSRDDGEASSASCAGPLLRSADPPVVSEVDEAEELYMDYAEFRALSAVAGSVVVAASPPRSVSSDDDTTKPWRLSHGRLPQNSPALAMLGTR